MLSLRIALTALTFASPCAFADQPWLSDLGPLPLDMNQAERLFQQCSRTAPSPGKPFWEPTTEQLRALDQDLAAFLLKDSTGAAKALSINAQYRGQFVGFTRGGVSLIYGSFIASRAVEKGGASGAPIIACDGGSIFWGIVYNPTDRTFTDLEINGHI
jgi:hypothetical protein